MREIIGPLLAFLICILLFVLLLFGPPAPNEVRIIADRLATNNTTVEIDKDYEFVDFSKTYEGDACTLVIRYKRR